jgi:NADH-quinone oxidoreductase subunit K
VFIIILAASEAAIALAIVLQVYRGYRSIFSDQLTDLKH